MPTGVSLRRVRPRQAVSQFCTLQSVTRFMENLWSQDEEQLALLALILDPVQEHVSSCRPPKLSATWAKNEGKIPGKSEDDLENVSRWAEDAFRAPLLDSWICPVALVRCLQAPAFGCHIPPLDCWLRNPPGPRTFGHGGARDRSPCLPHSFGQQRRVLCRLDTNKVLQI